jgi:hypothetical protein
MSKPKTSTHWASVTSAIARRAGVDFRTAKQIYDRVRAARGSPPSVGVARNLPTNSLRAYKAANTRAQRQAARQAAPEIQQRARQRQRELAESRAASARQQRPAAPAPGRPARQQTTPAAPPEPAGKRPRLLPAPPPRQRERVPAAAPLGRQPRNQFERFCKQYGAPEVTGTLAALIAREYRNPELQRALAKVLADARRQVDKSGFVHAKTKALARKLLAQVEGTTPGHWFAFLRRAYSIRIRY